MKNNDLPQVIYAVASPKSKGGVSLFDAPFPVTSDHVSEFHSEPDLIEAAVNKLKAEGFEILHVNPIMIGIAATPEVYEKVFKTKIVPVEKNVQKFNELTTSTFLDSLNTDIPGLIDVSKSSLSDVLEGVAIEEPRFYFALMERAIETQPSDKMLEHSANVLGKPNPFPPSVAYWHLDVPGDISLGLNADRIHRQGITGRNVKVVMIDSGWYAHPFFIERGYHYNPVVLGPGAENPEHDESGHGTGESANIFAVAPDIEFTMIKTTLKIVTSAIDVSKAMELQPQIISISWGSDLVDRRDFDHQNPNISAANKALAAIIAEAVRQGITVVCSAGNGQFSFPGQHPDVISAGGVYMHADQTFEATPYASGFPSLIFNNRNSPDVCGLVGLPPSAKYIVLPVEPGDGIDRTLGNRSGDGDLTLPIDGWAVFSGTSAAAPQLAGISALIKQVAPHFSPQQIKETLKQTARDVTVGQSSPRTHIPPTGEGYKAPARPDTATGFGLADAYQAVLRANR
ncbi:hypothetical protein HMSSN036_66970 [Paenibacillus macerans]|nr:hypothetical protein HMSSN036_66970 [Paenibacillus macerans]